MTKKEIIEFVKQSNCVWKPDTVYRRVQKGMSLKDAMNAPAGSEVTQGQRFYVYQLMENDICFYVGSGTGDRAWRHGIKPYIDLDTKVAEKIRLLLPAGYEVLIVKKNLTKQEARELECLKIRELKPECNWIGNLKYQIWGKEFVSLEEVSKDARCQCSYALLRHRISYGWSLEESVGPRRRQAGNPHQPRGSNGKFAP